MGCESQGGMSRQALERSMSAHLWLCCVTYQKSYRPCMSCNASQKSISMKWEEQNTGEMRICRSLN